MKPILLGAAITLALATGCNKQQPEDTTTAAPVAAEEPAAPAEVLTVVPASLTVHDASAGADTPTMTVSITATGDIEAGGQVVGKVTSDGRVLDPGGNELLALAADGSVSANGQTAPLTVREDGTIEKDGAALLTIAEDGTVGGELLAQAPEGSSVTYEGDAAGRRAMALVWLLSMLSQPAETSGQPAAPAETAPAPEASPDAP